MPPRSEIGRNSLLISLICPVFLSFSSQIVQARPATQNVIHAALVNTRLPLTSPNSDSQTNENALIESIKSAADPNKSLQAALEFLKAYPTSSSRADVADTVGEKIGSIQDDAERRELSEKFIGAFLNPGEVDQLFDVLEEKGLIADVFLLSKIRLQKVPDEIRILTELTLIASTELKRGDRRYLPVAETYGIKAISLFEGLRRPRHRMLDPDWIAFRLKYLPAMYQIVGVIAYQKKDEINAQRYLLKCLDFNQNDALAWLTLGEISDNHYRDAAVLYKAKPTKQSLKRATDQMDNAIDLYAHAAAVSEADTEQQGVYKLAVTSLEKYYRFRHKDSTVGMQELINRYKKPVVH